MTSDDSQTFYAARYDSSDNFIRNQIVEWSTTGTLDPVNVIDTALVFSHPSYSGIGTIIATAGSLIDTTGLIQVVNCCAPHYIKIRDTSDGGGKEVTTVTMTTDDSLTFFAAGYDAQNNFIQDLDVNWSLNGSLDGFPISGTSFIFNPTLAPTSGTILASVDDISDATGTITVNPGELCYIKIRCSSNNSPACFPEYEDTVTVYVGERLSLWFAGFDCDGNYRGDEPVSIDSTDIEYTGTLMVENWIFTEPGRGRIIVSGIDTSGVIIVTENPASVTTNNIIPSQFKLDAAYPNPFNPSTTIKFHLPKPEYVKIQIYNNIGQKIETLIDRKLNAGEHIVEFYARHLSSGVYYYRLVTPHFTDVKKFILMK